MSSSVHGITKYIKRLEVIAEACGEKKVAAAVEKDEFIRMKSHMYLLVTEIRDGVHERKNLISRRGICHETITKGHECRSKMQELQRSLPQLQQLHKKAMGKRNASQKKEELAARYQEIRLLKKHVDEVRDLLEGQGENMEDPMAGAGVSAQLLGLRSTAGVKGETGRAMDGEEQQAMADIKARDANIDAQLGEIGNVAERLGDIAHTIGHEAQKQKAKADALQEGIEQNTTEIVRQTEFTKEIIRYEKNTTFMCQMVLGLLLLCVVGFICKQIGLS